MDMVHCAALSPISFRTKGNIMEQAEMVFTCEYVALYWSASISGKMGVEIISNDQFPISKKIIEV